MPWSWKKREKKLHTIRDLVLNINKKEEIFFGCISIYKEYTQEYEDYNSELSELSEPSENEFTKNYYNYLMFCYIRDDLVKKEVNLNTVLSQLNSEDTIQEDIDIIDEDKPLILRIIRTILKNLIENETYYDFLKKSMKGYYESNYKKISGENYIKNSCPDLEEIKKKIIQCIKNNLELFNKFIKIESFPNLYNDIHILDNGDLKIYEVFFPTFAEKLISNIINKELLFNKCVKIWNIYNTIIQEKNIILKEDPSYDHAYLTLKIEKLDHYNEMKTITNNFSESINENENEYEYEGTSAKIHKYTLHLIFTIINGLLLDNERLGICFTYEVLASRDDINFIYFLNYFYKNNIEGLKNRSKERFSLRLEPGLGYRMVEYQAPIINNRYNNDYGVVGGGKLTRKRGKQTKKKKKNKQRKQSGKKIRSKRKAKKK